MVARARFGAAALGSGSNPEAATTYTYDRRGGLDTITLPSGVISDYTYDAAGNRESWLKDTDPAFGSTGTGFLTFDVQSFAAEVTVTYDYDANDRLLTETLDAPGAADDRHAVYDWDGGDSTMQLCKVAHDTLDDTGDVVREESFTYSAREATATQYFAIRRTVDALPAELRRVVYVLRSTFQVP